MKKFAELAQANVDHYNDHPTSHTVIATVAAVAGFVAIAKFAQWAGRSQLPQEIRNG